MTDLMLKMSFKPEPNDLFSNLLNLIDAESHMNVYHPFFHLVVLAFHQNDFDPF